MATVDMTVGTANNTTGNHVSVTNSPLVYTVERIINWAS